jgi:hypothetical protein
MIHTIKQVGIILVTTLNEALENLSKAVIEIVAFDNRSIINEEVSQIIDLNFKESHNIHIKLYTSCFYLKF